MVLRHCWLMALLLVVLGSGFGGTAAIVHAVAVEIPELTGPVNDFAGVIEPDAERQIEQLSRKLQSATGDTLVVVTVPTVEPFADIREYAVRLFENRGRGIGQKGKD